MNKKDIKDMKVKYSVLFEEPPAKPAPRAPSPLRAPASRQPSVPERPKKRESVGAKRSQFKKAATVTLAQNLQDPIIEEADRISPRNFAIRTPPDQKASRFE